MIERCILLLMALCLIAGCAQSGGGAISAGTLSASESAAPPKVEAALPDAPAPPVTFDRFDEALARRLLDAPTTARSTMPAEGTADFGGAARFGPIGAASLSLQVAFASGGVTGEIFDLETTADDAVAPVAGRLSLSGRVSSGIGVRLDMTGEVVWPDGRRGRLDGTLRGLFRDEGASAVSGVISDVAVIGGRPAMTGEFYAERAR